MSQHTGSSEQQLFAARTHWKILIWPAIVQIVMIFAHLAIVTWLPTFDVEVIDRWLPVVLHTIVVIIELIYVIVPLLKWLNTRFVITTSRVRMTAGVLNKSSHEIQISRITEVRVQRGLIDRLFGCGSIGIYVASSTEPAVLDDVPNVKQAEMILKRLIEAEA